MNASRLCWICNTNIADTSEHALKKADIVRAYGKGSYSSLGEKQPIHYKDGKQTKLQGANSDVLKNPKDLCKQCNNQLTQPYDHAYDQFIRYVIDNSDLILEKRFIDFEEVYGDDFPIQQTNLFKYFLKSFGCRIYANPDFEVPFDVVEILKNDRDFFNTGLKITMSLNKEIIIKFGKDCFHSPIGKTEMSYHIFQDNSKQLGFSFSEHIGCFFINYFYLIDVDERSGSEWIANRKVLFIGELEEFNFFD
ncbi:hypothetical protein [Acinetobacter silvestris]|uniref:Uncharacterized protein n=1 Tax=Acinetobacter silvestris TaxID=1977882 RepID=A0A1Y3CI67_9GAMM|nr:hypothetical protein [Acinetobacter silvestris]OTG66068.1 hypothetical protein B9T28_07715 [Acinetobacter silvestris]